MTLIGDLGGFNGAIMLIPTLMMSIYSKTMFESSLEQEIPVRRANDRKNKKPKNGLEQDVCLPSIGQ